MSAGGPVRALSPAAAGEAETVPGVAADTATQDRRHLKAILVLCCTAQFMVILDVSIVNVALPTIRASLGFSLTGLQWVVNAYTITFAGFLMLGGRAADLLGQRRTILAGFALFALASLAGGVAVSQGMLIGARAAQGLGGAIIAPASLSIITTTFADGPARHRAVGLWGAMNGAGGAAGVLLGGIITQALSWRWILLINLPIGLAAIAATLAYVPALRGRSGGEREFDLAGALTITGGLLALVYGVVTAASRGWGASQTLVPIAAGILLLGAFVLVEGRLAAQPLMPLRIFSSPLLRAANIVVVLLSAAIFPMWYFTSLYLQEVLHYTPLGAGIAFLPMALTIFGCATQAGRLVARYGAGTVLGTGLTSLGIGLALMVRIGATGGYVSDVLPATLLVAVGIGLSIVPSTIAAVAGVRPQQAGLASGLVNTSRQVGGALGLAVLATLAATYTTHMINVGLRAPLVALTDGFRLAYLVAGAFAFTGAVLTYVLIGRVRPGGPRPAAVPEPRDADAATGPPGSAPGPAGALAAAPTALPGPAHTAPAAVPEAGSQAREAAAEAVPVPSAGATPAPASAANAAVAAAAVPAPVRDPRQAGPCCIVVHWPGGGEPVSFAARAEISSSVSFAGGHARVTERPPPRHRGVPRGRNGSSRLSRSSATRSVPTAWTLTGPESGGR